MASVKQLLQRRISAKNFTPSAPLDPAVIALLLDSARMAPSAYNLQHTRFIVLESEEDKQRLYEAAYFQQKILNAAANIVVLADTEADLHIADIAEACVSAGSYDQSYAQRQCQQIARIYQGEHAWQLRRDESIRSASLASMCLLLQATDIGLGSCPLSGFDSDKLQRQFALPKYMLPVMIISLGSAEAGPAKPRKAIDDLLFTPATAAAL